MKKIKNESIYNNEIFIHVYNILVVGIKFSSIFLFETQIMHVEIFKAPHTRLDSAMRSDFLIFLSRQFALTKISLKIL